MKFPRFRLFNKRTFWWPTWRLGVLLCVTVLVVVWFVVSHLHGFLAQNAPAEGARVAIVEGWMADQCMVIVAGDAKAGKYDLVYTTGSEIGRGGWLCEYGSFPVLAEKTLERLGLAEEMVIPAPSSASQKHRTFDSALNLKKMLLEQGKIGGGKPVLKMNLISEGPHARRSLLAFQKAFGDLAEIGNVALPPLGYDPKLWWKSSGGLKGVITEALGWFYEWVADSGRED
jgi:hypothetical protein